MDEAPLPVFNNLQHHEGQLREVIVPLRHHLKTRARLDGPREAIVFDIDGTALNDVRSLWPVGPPFPAFVPVRDLYHDVKAMGYHLIFLTGRQEYTRTATELLLTQAGYSDWHALLMYPTDERHAVDEIEIWKDAERKKLKEGGYYLVACIGDQPMDVEGEHLGEHQTRLPQPPGAGCVIM